MSRIIFAWELGNSLGHLCRMIPIARTLADAGHTIYFATKNIVATRRFVGRQEFVILPCPAPESEFPIGREPASYADILAINGFAERETFHSLARAWNDIFSLIDADILIADHAPMALISARLSGLKSIHIGDGFTIPPLLSPLPNFRPCNTTVNEVRCELESQLLDMVNESCGRSNIEKVRILAEAFQGDVTLLATIPELDPYQSNRGADAKFIGKIPYNEDSDASVDWHYSALPHVFLYLSEQTWTDQVLSLLAASPVEAIVVIPGMSAFSAARYSRAPHLRVYTSFMQLAALWSSCDIAVSHGGQGITLECLMNSVPMLLLPNHVEQFLTTKIVANAGAGIGILPDFVSAKFAEVLNAMLANKNYKRQAQELAKKYQGADRSCTIEAVTAYLEPHIRTR